jgi:glutamyl-tRNA synthetase
MPSDVRCRIAPSPTGEPHVGTAYIALMNLCFARKSNGSFILRIEDTDQARSSRASEQSILDSLRWLGFDWDEGPDRGGPFGPYRQSERLSVYRDAVETLLRSGHAYHCFCTPEELDAMRKKQMAEKKDPGYFGAESRCRRLSPETVREKLERNTPHVIRLAVPEGEGVVSFRDEIRRQEISRRTAEIDDQVLIKSDGFPTYHFASVVDDHAMKISHVFRGEEWINSTFKHILLYCSFGWEPPRFFHLGLLRNPDANKSKISKRRNPVSLRWFRAAGYLPEALVNFLGLMGYSRYREDLSEAEKKTWEIFTLETLQNEFDETRLTPTGPAFDFEKLEDLNYHYVSRLSPDDFYAHLTDRLLYLKSYFGKYHPLFQERYLRAQKEVTYWSAFLFRQELEYRAPDFEKSGMKDPKQASRVLSQFKKRLSREADRLDDEEKISGFIRESAQALEVKSRTLHMLIRVAVTGSTESIPLYQAMLLLGLHRAAVRCARGAEFLNRLPAGKPA